LQVNGLQDDLGHEKRQTATNFASLIAPDHKDASKMLGYCLASGRPATWTLFTKFAALALTDEERAALAFAALNSLSLEHAEMASAASLRAAGAPLPPFLGGMDDARFWASCASRSELKAYAAAAYEAMTPADQAAFFRHISEVEVAA
jgi:predicted outer membrane lipoprotein